MVDIEVLYIPLSNIPIRVLLRLKDGATVTDALQQSGLLEQYPEIAALPLGIFSKPVNGEHLLHTGDRVEVYRPLQINPKDRRRDRAKKIS